MVEYNIGNELMAMELPKMIQEIGKAVSEANKEAADFHVTEAEVELRIAIHVEKAMEGGAEVGGKLWGVGINASYQGKYGYSAEGASVIKLKFHAGPK